MHSPYSFYVQLDDEMGEAGLNSHVRPTLKEFTQINFFQRMFE